MLKPAVFGHSFPNRNLNVKYDFFFFLHFPDGTEIKSSILLCLDDVWMEGDEGRIEEENGK